MQLAAFEERNWDADPRKWEKAYAHMGGYGAPSMLGYWRHVTRE